MSGLAVVFWKELADHFASKRFIILFLLTYLAGIAAAYIAAQTIRSEVTEATEFVFLKVFTTSGGVLPPFVFFIVLFIPLIGIALGFDAINSEKVSGTLSRVLAQPIFRDAVINGKFLAGIVTLAIMLVSILLIASGMALYLIGVPPSSEEVLRLMAFLVVSIFYGGFWLGLAILFSLLFERTATSLLASLALWLFFTFFMFMIAGVIAGLIMPLDQTTDPQIEVKHREVEALIMRISPVTLFEESVIALLVPGVRTLGPVLVKEAAHMLPNPLSIEQSLLIVVPQLTSLLALTIICFALSYVKFMREEIRAG